ncbi:MAG: exosortase/archaeosortase family protein, partial [Planctomycetota bacterium]
MSQSPSINTLAGATSGLREPDQSPARAAPAGPREPMQSKVVWCLIGLAGLLFVALFWEVIVRGARAAVDPDWAHILAAPAVALAYIAANRQRISEMPARLCWSGLVIMFVGLFSYLWWVFPGRNDMFRGYSLILTLFGMVLFTYGPGRMKVLWFPIAYLVFAVKIPDSIWEQVAFQLTLVAAAGSEISLEVCGKLFDYYIVKEGQAFTMMWTDDSGRLRQESFNIANACSGLRALMTFIALGVAMAFLWDRQWWQRIVMMAAAVPVALAVNIARVTSLGLLNLVNPAWAQGDSHVGVGMLWLVPGLIVFLGIGKLLDLMVIEPEGDERPDPREQRVLPGRVEFLTYASLLVGALVAVKLAGFLDGPVMGLTALPMSLIDLAIAAVVTAAIVFEVFRKPLERFAHRSVWKASAPIGDEPDEGVPARAIELVPVLLGGTVLALFVGGAYVLVLNGASGNPMFPALGPALSYVAAVVSIMGAIA